MLLSLIVFLIIGALAGWAAGEIMKGSGYGLLGNMALGIVGAYVGGFLFSLLGIGADGTIGQFIVATIGAIIIIWVAQRLR